LNVDDGKTPHGQSDARFDEQAIAIGAAVADGIIHLTQRVPFSGPLIAVRYAADPAHYRAALSSISWY